MDDTQLALNSGHLICTEVFDNSILRLGNKSNPNNMLADALVNTSAYSRWTAYGLAANCWPTGQQILKVSVLLLCYSESVVFLKLGLLPTH